ncbi:hypothetical protein O6P43_010529 [Quillaja saponaria]|uniref:Uncharacterized protein n=1 Tax=Quillaja saponaria TaxID=32244 RepID=A0AAD7Q123_QUISA|nr:hypothetical protein O6P43_010529 [Quillaja saponaria]
MTANHVLALTDHSLRTFPCFFFDIFFPVVFYLLSNFISKNKIISSGFLTNFIEKEKAAGDFHFTSSTIVQLEARTRKLLIITITLARTDGVMKLDVRTYSSSWVDLHAKREV